MSTCFKCEGAGVVLKVSEADIVLRPELSVAEGAIVSVPRLKLERLLRELSSELPFDINAPWERLEPETRAQILGGVDADRWLNLSPYFRVGARTDKEYDGLIEIFEYTFKGGEGIGSEQECTVCHGKPLHRPSPRERIEAIVKENRRVKGKSGGKKKGGKLIALMLTGMSGALKLVEALRAQEIPFRTRPELLLVDEGSLKKKHSRYRRWLVFVRFADRARAAEVVERRGGGLTQHTLPVLYLSGPLCMKPGHDFELEPCSWCHTGHDWLGRADALGPIPSLSMPEDTL